MSAPRPDRVGAVHTKRLVLHETASHGVSPRTAVGTDTIRSRRTHEVIGFDSFTGTFYPREDRAVFDVAFAFQRGIITARVTLTFSDARFNGRILKGTGAFKGVEGTVTGRSTDSPKTFITLHYRL